MFTYEYKKNTKNYWVLYDDIEGKFGPFESIFIRNKYVGNSDMSSYESDAQLQKYANHKYAWGLYKKNIFIISSQGIEDIYLLTN